MAGLRRICRSHGGLIAKGADGVTVVYRWDERTQQPVVVNKAALRSAGEAAQRARAKPWTK